MLERLAPMAPNQLSIAHLADAAAIAYNERLAFDIHGTLDPELLRASFDSVVARHAILRSRYDFEGSPPRQIVDDTAAFDFRHSILTQNRDLDGALQEFWSQAFDLTRGPLLRVLLVQLEPTEHLLALSLPQIITDRTSLELLVSDTVQTYQRFARGQLGAQGEDGPSYAEFAQQAHERLDAGLREKQLRYWSSQLAGAELAIGLSVVSARRPTPRTRREQFQLQSEHVARLKDLSRQHGATLFMTLVASLSAVLATWTSNHDIVVATFLENRPPAFDRVLGFFVNTVLLRVEVDPNLTLGGLIERVRTTTLAAFEHREVPFVEVLDAVFRGRSAASAVEVAIVLRPRVAAMPPLPGLVIDRRTVTEPGSRFALNIGVDEDTNGNLFAELDFDETVIDALSTSRIADGWSRCLRAAGDGQLPLARVELWPPQGPAPFLLRGPSRATHARDSLEGLIRDALERAGERVVATPPALTWGEIDRRSRAVAAWLRANGAQRGERVAVALSRSAELTYLILGIWRAGAVYVSLDPDGPSERARYILDDAGVRICFCEASSRIPTGPWQQVALGAATQAIPASGEEASLAASADEPRCLMYTSGSTGQPKGVLISERALVNRILWGLNAFPIAAEEVCAQRTPLVFIDSLAEMFVPLLAPARLVFLSEEEARVPLALLNAAARERVNRMTLVPSLLRQVVAEAVERAREIPFRYVIVSGEALRAADVSAWYRAWPAARLINLYGSTEVMGDATVYNTMDDVPSERSSLVSLGSPVSNTRVYVVDAQLRPLPPGATGEICVAGDCLALHYWNAPELSAQRFASVPFDVAGRVFRTGDLGRLSATGKLEFVSRLGAIVKIDGMRVDPAEVEHAIRVTAKVDELVVVPVTSPAGQAELVALYVARSQLSALAVKSALREWLPHYMTPRALRRVQALPHTPSGKLDRRAAVAIAESLVTERAAPPPPRNETERAIARIWTAALGTSAIGITDTFYDLGGRSKQAIEVLRHLSRDLGLNVTVRELMILSLAELAARSGNESAE